MPLFTIWATACLMTFCLTPVVIILAKHLGLVDDPVKRYHPAHTHIGVIPRAGGLALYLGLFFAIQYFTTPSPLILGILAGGALLTIVGLLDDKKDVHPYIRLMTNAIAAIIVIWAGVRIPYVTNPLGEGVIYLDSIQIILPLAQGIAINAAEIIAFIWIMWTMNIVGWSAGVDGQMPGFVGIAALTMGILSLRYSALDITQWHVTVLAFITCGVFVGFLPWNFFPQKIMPGYSGKTLAGFLLAILGILSYAKLGTALLVLSIPMIDAGYTLFRRITSGKSPVWADRGHLHHKLLERGWGKRRIALFYWGVSAILGSIALIVTSKQKLFTFLLAAVIIIGLLTWVHFFTQFSKPHDQDNG